MKNEKDIQRVTSRFMQDLYEEQDGGRWAGDDLLLIRHMCERSSQVFGSGEPFQIDRLHVGIVVSGEQDVTVNLRQHHLAEGSVLIASPESIMQENGRTEDFDMQVVHVSDLLLQKIFGVQTPSLFAHHMNDMSLRLDDPSFALLLSMLDGLWQSAHTDFEVCSNHLLPSSVSSPVSRSATNSARAASREMSPFSTISSISWQSIVTTSVHSTSTPTVSV